MLIYNQTLPKESIHAMPDADLLALLRHGPLDAPSLCQRLAISQPTLSRRIAEAGDAIVRIGRARATRYLARRAVRAQHSFVLYQVDASGQAAPWGELIPVHPGFVWRANNGVSNWSEGLPWCLQDMRPQGFLGRAWGRARASALALPEDVQDWSDEHVLIALAAGEADAPGNLLIGQASLAAWRTHAPLSLRREQRAEHYPRLAAQVMAGEPIGSSAGGEQPKFAVRVDGRDVLVKFGAASNNAVSQRWRDLLRAEHLALRTLAEHGLAAADSEIFEHDGQCFLQLTRFDRTPAGGRLALTSLAALDAEFLGLGAAVWPQYTAALLAQHRITPRAHHDACRLYAFGVLIGNTDMHTGNLSFLHNDPHPLELAPAYDMLPMALAPNRQGDMRDSIPRPVQNSWVTPEIWAEMEAVAQGYWARVGWGKA